MPGLSPSEAFWPEIYPIHGIGLGQMANVVIHKPQPHYDIELAKISRWLVRHSMTCHVSLAGTLELHDRSSTPEDAKSSYRRSIIRRSSGMAVINGTPAAAL